MKKYEVLIAFNSSNGRDVRVRSDIDNHKGFTRMEFPNVKERFVLHTDFRTGNQRMFHVAFQGSERDAKRFAEGQKLIYDGVGVTRSILRQVNNNV